MKTFHKLYRVSRIWILLLIVLTLPYWIPNNYYLQVANLGMIFSILTLSLNILAGYTGLFSVGFIAFYGIGAYTSAIVVTRLGWSVWVGFILAGVVSSLFSFLLGLPTMRLRGMYFAVATLAFGEIMYQVFLNWTSITGGTKGIKGVPSPEFFGISLRPYSKYFYLILAVLVIVILLTRNLINSRTGRAMLAIRENDIAAEAMGVDVPKFKMIAFLIATFFAGVAGALYGHEVRYVSPESFVNAESAAVLAMMVVGGIGSIPGSILGGFILTMLPEYLRFLGNIRLVIYGAAIVAIIIFAPKGLGGLIEWIDGFLSGTLKLGTHKKSTEKVEGENGHS
ncbi:branched-chain amino acid ABC transporter permease [Flexilinea flocculi]|jgi:branched-chain amino acid transport system permease protein|uniref:ABC-type branched-chain amino acid transport system, permease component n=1 Tax=Flexilinea flocculi TaxID=1678840 RepID=A0A0K8PB26_9CHLR|nr:branched-chain amino acid ABC transporter permease [Flexilinea flocculi]GAP39851.1 ABC-type branched-chain amino acid transport system, permease component [Flexilinea flocculi]